MSAPLRDGTRTAVQVRGEWIEPVASYYRQKSQSGLYQALHRIRPYIARDYDRHIFVFTNMPIPGVKVDYILRTEAQQRLHSRMQEAIACLIKQLDTRGECSVPELAGMVLGGGENRRAIDTWITRRLAEIADATESTFVEGSAPRPGKFMRHGDTNI